jgi:RNA polymerase sigma factor (sigma-70 family)
VKIIHTKGLLRVVKPVVVAKCNEMRRSEDTALIEAIKNDQNSKYIELMYKRFFERAKWIAYKGGGNLEDAKDLLHDTVLLFFKHVKDNKYNLNADIDAFLYTIAKNRWVNKAVRDKRMETREKPLESPNNDTSLLQNIYSKERASAVKTILEQLGDRCKELLTLIYYEEKTMAEVCEQMGYTNTDVAKTKHYKCKQRMEAIINESGTYKALLSKNG